MGLESPDIHVIKARSEALYSQNCLMLILVSVTFAVTFHKDCSEELNW